MSLAKTTALFFALATTGTSATAPQKTMVYPVLGADLPLYPPLARQTRTEGRVEVQIQVDGAGKVVSAVAVSGDPVLRRAAVDNAKSWRFAPTSTEGTIVYDFKIEGQAETNDPYYRYGKVIFRPPNSVEIDFPPVIVVSNSQKPRGKGSLQQARGAQD
jgi:TonB family protein